MYLSSLFLIAPDHFRISRLFLKLLTLIYFAAFYSLGGQMAGLVGPDGILPFQEVLDSAFQRHGGVSWLMIPSLFWLNSDAITLTATAYIGCLFALLLLFGKLERLSLILLFILYLSLHHAGQFFLNFQWDYLLLETGFLAIFIVNGPPRIIIILFHLLLFRLRFLSGMSKVISGDPSWSGLTALNHYFETQPLPHVGAWYAHQLPDWLLQAGTAFTLFVELLVPFFIFLPRPFRLFAAAVTILIQLLIIATSNHNFINLLTILLCLFLLDDRLIQGIKARFLNIDIIDAQSTLRVNRSKVVILSLVFIIIFSTSIVSAFKMVVQKPLPSPWDQVLVQVQYFGIGNAYHVFPTMQTERQELEIQGSVDGKEWKSYQFSYKPMALDQTPPFIVPHQPRLDWMIWFVPAQNMEMNYWFNKFMMQLWRNEKAVTELLSHNPFKDEAPKYLRVLVYRYQFTTFEERSQNGNWWKRIYLGEFPNVPPRRP